MADQTVISAIRYPGGILRAMVQDAQGQTTEVEWYYLPNTMLPPIELPAGVLMKAFVDGGGQVGEGTATVLPVPNFKPSVGDGSPVINPASLETVAVTRLQGRLALSRARLLDKAEAAIAAAGGETVIWYADAQTWRRDDPHIAPIGQAIGLASADVDALFKTAGSI